MNLFFAHKNTFKRVEFGDLGQSADYFAHVFKSCHVAQFLFQFKFQCLHVLSWLLSLLALRVKLMLLYRDFLPQGSKQRVVLTQSTALLAREQIMLNRLLLLLLISHNKTGVLQMKGHKQPIRILLLVTNQSQAW